MAGGECAGTDGETGALSGNGMGAPNRRGDDLLPWQPSSIGAVSDSVQASYERERQGDARK